MIKWFKEKDPSRLAPTGSSAKPVTEISTLVEKILLDHRENKHRVFLISSTSERDCVNRVGHILGDLLKKRCQLSASVVEANQEPDAAPMCRRLSDALSGDHDIVLLIVPGLLRGDFPSTVLNHCDSCILFVVAGQTRKIHVKESLRQLEQHAIPVLGTVLFNTRQIIPAWLYNRFFVRLA